MDFGNLNTMNAPWGLASRKKLVFAALDFFDADKYTNNCVIIDKDPNIFPNLFSLSEFVTYLKKKNVFVKKEPNIFRIISILDKAVSGGIFLNLRNEPGKAPGVHDNYLLTQPFCESAVRGQGDLWLVPALGSDFLYDQMSSGIVHITGTDANEAAGGTGVILDEHHILTCAHVVRDMQVNDEQIFQGVKCIINCNSIFRDDEEDVAIIYVDEVLKPVPGMVFQNPVIGKNIFALGFPQIPCTKHDPTPTMHGGAVTNELVTLYTDMGEENMFLYSAISRPGNSGGPIISEDGYVVGIASKDLTQKKMDGELFSPHYAGVPAHVIMKSIKSMRLGIQIPFEDFE